MNTLIKINIANLTGSYRSLLTRTPVSPATPTTTELGSEVNVTELDVVRRNLRLDAEALQRMENEGGIPLGTRQEAQADQGRVLNRRIQKLLSAA